jgi:hypothetical protein
MNEMMMYVNAGAHNVDTVEDGETDDGVFMVWVL